MSNYIPLHLPLLKSHKFRKFRLSLGLDVPNALFHLVNLWWWSMDHAPDGDITDLDHEDLAWGAEWEGDATTFVQALVKSGFIDTDDRNHPVALHDWMEYGGRLIEKKRKDAERKKEARDAGKRSTSIGLPLDVQRMSDVKEMRGEESKEEETNKKNINIIPNVEGANALGHPLMGDGDDGLASTLRTEPDEVFAILKAARPQLTRDSRTIAYLNHIIAKYPAVDPIQCAHVCVEWWMSLKGTRPPNLVAQWDGFMMRANGKGTCPRKVKEPDGPLDATTTPIDPEGARKRREAFAELERRAILREQEERNASTG